MNKKIEQGRVCQERAKIAFERGDFEEAYYYYVQAEDLYRQGYDTPGAYVFYMQSTAIRCLEELMDERPIFYNTYRSKVDLFLKEWDKFTIVFRFGKDVRSANRMKEAYHFRFWRESYLRGFDAFRASSLAIEQGELDAAREILNEFIAKMEKYTGRESDALCAIARSKREMIAVRSELRKSEDARDDYGIIRGYLLAARASKLPKGSASRQGGRLKIYRHLYLSQALKFKAFDLLRNKQVGDPVIVLSKAARYLLRAIIYNKKCGEGYYLTEQGLRYITDSRNKRPDQLFVLNHFDMVPTILQSPHIIGRNLEKPDNYLYFKETTAKEHGYRKLLFVVILKKSNINVVWNFYWLRQHKVPQTTAIVYQGKGSAKYLR